MIDKTLELEQVKDDATLKACVYCLNQAFENVATQFNLTKENAPNNGAFLDFGKLKSECCKGLKLYALLESGQVIGTLGVKKLGPGKFELVRLSILESHRGHGYGSMLLQRIQEIVGADLKKESKDIRSFELSLGCIAEDRRLIDLYEKAGFSVTRVKGFKRLVHKVCFMRKTVVL